MWINGLAVTATFGTLGAATLGLGLWASVACHRRKRNAAPNNDLILANRSIGLFLGVFSLVATYVGHTFVNGTTDAVFSRGLAWCQVPIGYGLSLFFGALLFSRQMRRAEYVTMLDPFQQHYGARLGSLMFLPAFFGDLFWCAALLRAFGASLNYVVGVEINLGVSVTALLLALYMIAGGLYSVVWTDAFQLICIASGLAAVAPYSVLHPAVQFEKSLMSKDWLGDIKADDLGEWVDTMLLAVFGGIPWQGYFQRILSIKNASFARTLSIASMFGCIALTVPMTMIGIIARATDRSLIESYNKNWRDNGNSIIPLILRYLTPQWVSLAGPISQRRSPSVTRSSASLCPGANIGLAAMWAGVMASADSSILGISSMFTRNIYKLTMRPKGSERELDWVLRITVAVVSFLCAVIALRMSSVYYLAFLCSDLVYVVLFPQLLSVIHWPSLVDSYGCLAGYVAAIVIRISGGEKSLGIPVFVEYPYYDTRTHTQKFPFRSLAMLSSIFAQLIVSFFTRNLFGGRLFPRCCDVLNVYSPGNAKNSNGVVQSTSGAALIDCTINDASSGHISDAPSTDYDASSTDTQLQSQVQQRYDMISVVYDSKLAQQTPGSAAHKANQTLQGLHNLRDSMSETATVAGRPQPPGSQQYHHHQHQATMIGNSLPPGQILGVKNLSFPPGNMNECSIPQRIMSPTTPSNISGTINFKVPTTIITNGRLEGDKVGGDRSNMELNLNLTDSSGIVKKNIKGVKLIGMEGGTLRRPSLQGAFSPTPSVEMVNIFDRRQSSGSFGPSSLSPIPGVEACKTHGTAISGQIGNEHCKIKRGIVRHHSFNDTGDRTLTTLARQPTYPSMPLRNDECRGMALQRKDQLGLNGGFPHQRKSCGQINRHSEACLRPPEDTISHMTTLRREKCRSVAGHHNISRYASYAEDHSQHGLIGHLLVSPTYSMYNSKNCSYFVSDDEAVSRF